MLAKNTITNEDIKSYKHYCTVKELKEFLREHNVPDDAKIFIQRIEDVYFEEHSWSTRKKEGFQYEQFKNYIDKAKPGGEFHNKDEYPNLTEDSINDILESEKYLSDALDEYVMVWSTVKYPNDDNVYLDAHY